VSTSSRVELIEWKAYARRACGVHVSNRSTFPRVP
jgi:hypothetical protein